MKNIKTFFSGINNMLIFLFKLDFTKWQVLFDNKFIRLSGFYTSSNYVLLPSLELLLFKDYVFTGSYGYRFMITFRFHKIVIFISFNNF